MIADVEKPDGTYAQVEMGEPECGMDFCDGCGDCLACQQHGDEDWCSAGSSRWVVYLTDPKNQYRVAPATDGSAGLPEVGRAVPPEAPKATREEVERLVAIEAAANELFNRNSDIKERTAGEILLALLRSRPEAPKGEQGDDRG